MLLYIVSHQYRKLITSALQRAYNQLKLLGLSKVIKVDRTLFLNVFLLQKLSLSGQFFFDNLKERLILFRMTTIEGKKCLNEPP